MTLSNFNIPNDPNLTFDNGNIFNFNLILQNSVIRLRPIEKKDALPFTSFIACGEIWKYFAYEMFSKQDIQHYVKEALLQRRQCIRYTFVVELKDNNKIIGSTALENYFPKDQRIEIGWSWLAKEFKGTQANKNIKFLLLTLAFDYLNIKRVEFKTDVLNKQARNALIKIGAVEEGILRSHTLMPNKKRRDTIYYSILANEWLNLKQNLFKNYSPLNLLNYR